MRFFPTYIVFSGFNGLLGLLQVFQQFQGVPVHWLPIMAAVPPALSLVSAYCGWQFCKEVQAIAAGLPGDGPQDTCFVRVMGGDWWPASMSGYDNPDASSGGAGMAGSGGGGANARFSAFGGDGHRLGEA